MYKTLPEFITEIGDAEAARLFQAPMRTIQSWRRRERTPRPAQAPMIIEASGGRVTYEGIYAQPADTSASGEGVSAGVTARGSAVTCGEDVHVRHPARDRGMAV